MSDFVPNTRFYEFVPSFLQKYHFGNVLFLELEAFFQLLEY